ncbi:MAG: hypothetical protein ACRD5H_14905, partial [Nitrososphaerales archaeon]
MQEQVTGQPWANFVQALNNKETYVGYTSDLKQYLQFLGTKSPEVLLQGMPAAMEDLILSFVKSKKAEGTSAPRIRRIVAAVKLFYEVNRIALNWKFVTRQIGRTKAQKDGAYSHADIKKALEVASLRDKVIILGLCSSGMRRGALAELRVKHLLPVDKIYRIAIYSGDEEEYVSYCTPECRAVIEEYFAYRKRCGENINPDSPVVRDEFNRDDPDRARFPKPLGASSISQIGIDVMERSGVRVRKQMTEGGKAYRIRHPVKA